MWINYWNKCVLVPRVPTISMCKCARPVAIDNAMASMTFVSTVRIVRKSKSEPFSWKSVTNHNCVHVPLSEMKNSYELIVISIIIISKIVLRQIMWLINFDWFLHSLLYDRQIINSNQIGFKLIAIVCLYLCYQLQWIREYFRGATWPFDRFQLRGTMSTLRD